MDWTGCDLVERIPGKVSGQPVVRGTRILADQIVQDAALGSPIEEIAENYPSLQIKVIRELLAFAHSHQAQPR
ncbi:MAG TPA: DUF433 domain-containing protein [Terriglobales bacterium]|nr:DUF433 domain-containing protein [Terriglobales bacterium]